MTQSNHSQLLSTDEEVQLRAAIEQDPGTAHFRGRLALHCWRSGDLSEALGWIDSSLEIDPTNVHYYRIRANVLVDRNLSARAVETALKATEILPESVLARLLTVRMLLADLKPTMAQEALDATLDLDPNHQQLHEMKSLQKQILNMISQSKRDPVKWLSRKLQKRKANVAGENQALA
ncbi:MAG: hypothetical protein HOC23_06645 [Halieaceae bacterium]|jgi:tetratricopeptide (TPR) repeat protein|nr:hypothetical protein [Halieaceae bacterium]